MTDILQRHRDAAHNYFISSRKPNALAQAFAASEARLIDRLGEPDMVQSVAEAIAADRGTAMVQHFDRSYAKAALAAVSDALKGE